MASSNSAKTTQLSLKDKVALITESAANPKMSARKLGMKYKVGKSTAARILSAKEKLLHEWEMNTSTDRKRKLRECDTRTLNEALKSWFDVAMSKNIPVTGPILQHKAKKFAAELLEDSTDFVASNGWLSNWKSAYNVDFGIICGESAEVVNSFTERIPELCEGYDPKDVWNLDETAVFTKPLPNKTFKLKGTKCSGGKLSKDRVSGMLMCNSDGSEKEKFLVIGRAKRPRAFKRLDLALDLPVVYRNNAKAWMTREIFSEFMKKFDRKMKLQRRKALVFSDNATSHHVSGLQEELTNTKLVFFPPNTTSILQPLDQGIIWSWKSFYKNLYLSRLVSKIDTGKNATEISKSIDIMDVCRWAASAWERVTKETIQNCFRHAGFKLESVEDMDIIVEQDDAITLQDLIDKIPGSELTADQFLHIEDEIPVSPQFSDSTWEADILESFKPTPEADENTEEISDDEEEEDVSPVEISHKEAQSALEVLREYSLSRCPQLANDVLVLQAKFDSIQIERQMGAKQSSLENWRLSNPNPKHQSPATVSAQRSPATDSSMDLSGQLSPRF